MEPEGSSPYTQKPATCPYPEPDQSSLRPHPTSRRAILILSSLQRQGLPSGLKFVMLFFIRERYLRRFQLSISEYIGLVWRYAVCSD
jgi:hypothetical protein